jgi:hypothetical protein
LLCKLASGGDGNRQMVGILTLVLTNARPLSTEAAWYSMD